MSSTRRRKRAAGKSRVQKSPPEPPVTTSISASEQAEAALVRSALDKLRAKESVTDAERRALARFEKKREHEQRWQFYRSIPQQDWRMMSGRQAKVLIEQADRYGIPFGGGVVDLPAVVKALHDFLAKNALVLARGTTQDDDRRRMNAIDMQLKEIELQERLGVLVRREDVRTFYADLAQVLRRFGDLLQRRFGADAFAIFSATMDDLQMQYDTNEVTR